MALNMKLVFFALVAVLFYVYLAPMMGIIGGGISAILFTLAGVLLVNMVWPILPFALNKNLQLILLVGAFIVGFTLYGWNLGFLGAGVTPGPPGATPSGPCIVSAELEGKASTLDINAWDMESNTPYSAAIDISSIRLYRDSNSGANFVAEISDTSGATSSNFHVGDTLYLYGGNATYYADKLEGICIDSQRQAISISGHTVVAESDMQIVAYDDTGSTVLGAAASTNYGDYNLTIGADEQASIYVKLKNNVANEAYQFCGWGVVEFYNISSVEPGSVATTYTKVFTPTHMDGVAVEVNTTTNTLTSDYTMYKSSVPIVLHEWDTVKEQFIVTSHSTNDPVDRQTTADAASLNGFAILAKDCTWASGDDGSSYFDFYAHTAAEGDVGLDETETSPRGKEVGVQVCAL